MKPLLAGLCLFLLASCKDPSPVNFQFGIAVEGDPGKERLEAFGSATGLPVEYVLLFDSWPSKPEHFDSPAPSIQAAGEALPVLTWEPWTFSSDGKPSVVDAKDILSGKWDAYIDRYLKEAASAGREVWIRFAHEMNTSHYHWGIPDAADFGPEAPFLYRKMFRYVVERSRKLGLTQIKWVFCPNAESVPYKDADWNQASRYYPGDEWVDVLGMDGYNWGTTVNTPEWQSRWMSFREIFGPLYQELKQLSPAKPIVVFETATATQGGDKASWIREAAETARKWNLKAVIWFDVNKETDWRLLTGVTPEDLTPLKSVQAR
jgi:beta-mannanase